MNSFCVHSHFDCLVLPFDLFRLSLRWTSIPESSTSALLPWHPSPWRWHGPASVLWCVTTTHTFKNTFAVTPLVDCKRNYGTGQGLKLTNCVTTSATTCKPSITSVPHLKWSHCIVAACPGFMSFSSSLSHADCWQGERSGGPELKVWDQRRLWLVLMSVIHLY